MRSYTSILLLCLIFGLLFVTCDPFSSYEGMCSFFLFLFLFFFFSFFFLSLFFFFCKFSFLDLYVLLRSIWLLRKCGKDVKPKSPMDVLNFIQSKT